MPSIQYMTRNFKILQIFLRKLPPNRLQFESLRGKYKIMDNKELSFKNGLMKMNKKFDAKK